MSRPRYGWWGYVKSMIRRYPELHAAAVAAHETPVAPKLSGSGGGHIGESRPVEQAALRELSGVQQREHNAVAAAIATTSGYRDGHERLKLVRLVFWTQTHTLEGAAQVCNVSYRTASGWHGEFIRLVASHFGLLD